MKKIILSLGMVFLFSVYAHSYAVEAGELNIKGSIDFGTIGTKQTWDKYPVEDSAGNFIEAGAGREGSQLMRVNASFGIWAEYLHIIVLDYLKLGAGAGYLAKRSLDRKWAVQYNNFEFMGEEYRDAPVEYTPIGFSIIPVYVTVQTNPIKQFREFFIKGNFGYTALFWADSPTLDQSVKMEKENGVYWQAGIGWEFYNGWLVELGYSVYYVHLKYSWDTQTYDDFLNEVETYNSYSFDTYSVVTLMAGYKFSL
ncbi:MAG: PorT family protein [Elusimicrobiota bacterium]|jgi:hypothetical protein|nr:PorT family protein [Elusimicrobiota bacterium]